MNRDNVTEEMFQNYNDTVSYLSHLKRCVIPLPSLVVGQEYTAHLYYEVHSTQQSPIYSLPTFTILIADHQLWS